MVISRFFQPHLWLYLPLLCLLVLPVSAQDDEPPLSAPLLATTPAAMDRIIVYDLSGGRRELVFGTGEHHIWGFS
ncbi:MAG: hypothetical protein SF029_26440, partial [bacterium]|nr:hypothetical protein [bacterium]